MDESSLNIPIHIMNDIKINNEFSKQFQVRGATANKNTFNFHIVLPGNKNIQRRMKHF
jgi:hypothetical protein